ncbi:MAG: septum site-determining protein MinC [Lachnospiraceae bacterium]
MQQNVKIKSYQNGISIHLNPDIAFSILLDEVVEKFKEVSNFFKDAKVALSIENRDLNEEEEELLLDAIQSNSSLNIICIVGKNVEKNNIYIKALERVLSLNNDDSGAFLYKGNIEAEQVLEEKRSIVIIGNILQGGVVHSTEDIIVFGTIEGEVHAGIEDEETSFDDTRKIIALQMKPERLKIGSYRYKTKDKPKWGFGNKSNPKIAHLKDNKVVLETYTEELLN